MAIAKLFAQSVGLRAWHLKTTGAEQSQGYQWENIKGKERRAYLIDLRFTREQGLWKMYFHTAFYVVEASASPTWRVQITAELYTNRHLPTAKREPCMDG